MSKSIGFIGLGAMGKPIAGNLIRKGFNLTVYDIRPEPVDELAELGARAAASSAEVARQSDIIITMLLSAPHVREAVLGEMGVIRGVRPGSVLIDMSTIDPETTREVSRRLVEAGVSMLDAPVARGVKAAREGTLAIFVGGDPAVFDSCRDVLEAMGTDVDHVGALGCGATVKLVNQLILANTVAVIAEGLVLGVKGGVDPDALYRVLENGSADSFALRNHYKNWAMKGRFDENVFPVDYILKDLGLILDTGKDLKVPLCLTALTEQIYEHARAAGKNRNYFPVVVTLLEELTGVRVRTSKD